MSRTFEGFSSEGEQKLSLAVNGRKAKAKRHDVHTRHMGIEISSIHRSHNNLVQQARKLHILYTHTDRHTQNNTHAVY